MCEKAVQLCHDRETQCELCEPVLAALACAAERECVPLLYLAALSYNTQHTTVTMQVQRHWRNVTHTARTRVTLLSLPCLVSTSGTLFRLAAACCHVQLLLPHAECRCCKCIVQVVAAADGVEQSSAVDSSDTQQRCSSVLPVAESFRTAFPLSLCCIQRRGHVTLPPANVTVTTAAATTMTVQRRLVTVQWHTCIQRTIVRSIVAA